jgi:uncharacterized protein (TIGR01244 family)
MQRAHFVPSILTAFLALATGCASEKTAPAKPQSHEPMTAPETRAGAKTPPISEKLESYSCGTIERLHTWNGIFVGSQPAAQDLRHAHDDGIKTILNFRPQSESPGFDEAALVAELGMQYEQLGFASPEQMTDELIAKARVILRDESKRPLLVHCHSGNRVGALWLAFRHLDGGLSWDAAVSEAKEVGLKSAALEQRIREYAARARASEVK